MGSQAVSSYKGSARLGSYLRRLRNGYGYSLRRVEERARAKGGEIDNSQLSRYEKGICYPSFDKLRVLASVFNVSIQSFSDIVELEAFEDLTPEADQPEQLRDEGTQALQRGENGLAFACYDRAISLLLDHPDTVGQRPLLSELHVHQAIALRRLGKLSLAEQELRNALRNAASLPPTLKTQAIQTLAGIHAMQGESFIAEIEATRAHELARAADNDRYAAMALHTLSNVLADQDRHEEAVERAREASALYAAAGDQYEAVRVRVNIGTHYVALGKIREGIRLLMEALTDARRSKFRRPEALSWSNLGEAYYRMDDPAKARRCFRESDALAAYKNDRQADVLFFNAFYEWKMAEKQDNPTRAKIAFGRLKALRSQLERRIREVDEFDAHVERGRAHA